jgi:hypothetical protein
MQIDAKESAYIEVPFQCPLPAICPVCGSQAEKSRQVRAWEGIPLFFTYHLSIGIPYCRSHYDQLAALEFRQRVSLWGVLLSPLVSVLPALADWSLRWLFYVGCLFSMVCLYRVLEYGVKIGASRGVQMRTLGSLPAYRLRSFRSDWNQMLEALVDQFKKTHRTKA